jgi:hypothetical protein
MKVNIILVALIAAMFFPFDTEATPGKPAERQVIRTVEKQIERVREVKVSDEECKVERLVSVEPSKPVRKLIGKLRLRKK